jgi:sugar lactone lactonase YvrE
LNFPEGITLDRNGILYISDTSNHVIRKVAADGTISTYAGTGGQPGFSGDGGQAASAKLNFPKNIIFDASNNLYIADAYNHSIRKVTPGGLITTFAGNQRYAFSGDGGPATQASMEYPQSVVFDATGNAYVLEENGVRIRRVTPGGIISSVAGTGLAGFSGDGGPSQAATLRYPLGSMAMDASGTLFFTDTSNHRVRSISLGQTSAPTISASPASLTFSAVSGGAATTAAPITVNASSFGLPFQVSTVTATDRCHFGDQPVHGEYQREPGGPSGRDLSGNGEGQLALRQSNHHQHRSHLHSAGCVFRQTGRRLQLAGLQRD